MLTGHDYTQLLSDQLGFTFAPNACRIDEAIAFLAAEHDRVHGISGGSGFGRDNGALRAGQLIQQSRLSDVRPADDGHLHLRCFRSTAVGFRWRWKIARDGSAVVGQQTSGVHDLEWPPEPGGSAVNPIASDPRLVRDDRPAGSCEPIEERRLPYVWAPNDNDGWQFWIHASVFLWLPSAQLIL